MGIFDRATATASRLIKKDGEACQWSVQGDPTIADPDKPWIKEDGDKTLTPVSILFTVDKSNPFINLLPASVVEGSGEKGLMFAVPFVPKADDVVIRSNQSKLTLQSATPLAPNGSAIIWYLVFKA